MRLFPGPKSRIRQEPSVFIFDSFSENCDLTSSNHCFRTVFFHNAYLMYCIACIGDRYLFLWFYGWLSYPNNTYVLFLAQHELHELGHFLAQFTKNSLPKIKNSPFLITNRNFYPKPQIFVDLRPTYFLQYSGKFWSK